MTIPQFEARGEIPAGSRGSNAVAAAIDLGLVHPNGSRGARLSQPYKLTSLGTEFCEGRVEFKVPYKFSENGRATGTHRRPIATWIRVLPGSYGEKSEAI